MTSARIFISLAILAVCAGIVLSTPADEESRSFQRESDSSHLPTDSGESETVGLLIEEWLYGGAELNTVLAERIQDAPETALYESLSDETIESTSVAETELFSENVAGLHFRRTVRTLCDEGIRHFRTVVQARGVVCAVFDEVRCVSEGMYLAGPVWHIDAETHPVVGMEGVLMIKDRAQIGLSAIGPKKSTRLELVDGPDAAPKEAEAHAFILDTADMARDDSARFASVFFPIQTKFPMTRPLLTETGGIGLAYLENRSARVVGSGRTGVENEFGPVRTDASCFFAGDRGRTMYIHFVGATKVSALAQTVVREVRLDGQELNREAWRFDKGRVILEWSEPRTGVIAIVTAPSLLPRND